MCKMGFDVPAEQANIPYFKTLMTHFSVEESVLSGCGKLKEELTRLVPMMKENYESAFIILNELFTTAANYDACIMGEKVLRHFIEKSYKGIYVTHLKELSELDTNVVSMRACIADNDYHRRTYKIIRDKAQDIAYAGDIVEKYQLTYEQLKRYMVVRK